MDGNLYNTNVTNHHAWVDGVHYSGDYDRWICQLCGDTGDKSYGCATCAERIFNAEETKAEPDEEKDQELQSGYDQDPDRYDYLTTATTHRISSPGNGAGAGAAAHDQPVYTNYSQGYDPTSELQDSRITHYFVISGAHIGCAMYSLEEARAKYEIRLQQGADPPFGIHLRMRTHDGQHHHWTTLESTDHYYSGD